MVVTLFYANNMYLSKLGVLTPVIPSTKKLITKASNAGEAKLAQSAQEAVRVQYPVLPIYPQSPSA